MRGLEKHHVEQNAMRIDGLTNRPVSVSKSLTSTIDQGGVIRAEALARA